ncbi:hypothetical protein JQT66_03315 [Sulfitobacter mediterraneus]|jgi:hypothetical protein|uniref:Lipoprotein n=1 Tax=Sulfitobacter mediterraneus TaxID=83219 RepID=A0A061SXW5_9RHOB|nr:hypothetical protein [Sulfitobacter mediterraneus]KAJ04890.1 hypothetical protein PM02_01375 [Sulfitobacter mediterraneus]MBM1309290.1 hypothetical protein [Sulfitobacter mediterraneus]MBM1313175.1 hypothetical protein [Sulfitobacter mediterraneus]MBM1321559.1 hypothetical protein [Sulfitobacter mediterraneus]MBM1325446.1 hypothetical protein [Sulfitobacter mediterraneus]
MKIIVPALMVAALLAGCTNKDKLTPFEGFYYRTKVAKVDKQLDVFTVTVRDASQSVEGARQAGEHAAISHCVRFYGTSDIEWTVGPDTPAEELRIVDDRLIFSGRCPQ